MLAERTGIETKIIEPLKNIKIPKKLETANIVTNDKSYSLNDISPMLAVAVGLALRRQGDR
jgi:Tfp pilus assembly PilM family ATPase